MLIFNSIQGSHLYGTAYRKGEHPTDPNYESDRDYRGIYIANFQEYVCLSPDKKGEQRHLDEKTDIVNYDLRKFLKLALQGNPNILEMLFTPKEFWLEETFKTNFWEKFYNIRHQFLSKRVKTAYYGFAKAMLKTLENKNRATKPKEAAHGLRLIFNGIQVAREADLSPVLYGKNLEFIKAVREGRIPHEDIVKISTDGLWDLCRLFEKTCIPQEPNYKLVNEVFYQCVEEFTNLWNKREE